MKANSKSLINLAFAGTLLLSMAAGHGAVVIESFESGTLNGWGAGTLNGTATTVNSVRASDGTFSAANSFTVAGSFGGWTVSTILQKDPRSFMDAGATTLTVDVYSDWANPNGWGVYANGLKLILNYQGGYQEIDPVSGSLSNGSFQTLTWNLTPHAATITNPALTYSSVGIAWHVGTWQGDGGNGSTTYTDNGTQTFAVDRISITSVPEPSAAAALGAMGVLALLRRRRF